MAQDRINQKIISSITQMHWSLRLVAAFFIGALAGILVLMPVNEYMIFVLYEHHNAAHFGEYLYNLFKDIFLFNKPVRIIYYSVIGAAMTYFITWIFTAIQRYRFKYLLVQEELNRNIGNLIETGENNYVEFKSSFRYDLNQQKVNRALELVIMKTLAGFMNSEGGTLLIGINDAGEIVGLGSDYKTLKKKDKDGFEQLLMTTISNTLGTAACKLVNLNFHEVEKKEVCRITVSVSSNPVYVKSDKSSKFYIRTGSGTREMELQEAVEFIQDKYVTK